MGTPARLQYHRTAFELLRREPVVSEEAVRLIEEAERHCGRRLVASVREWYSLRGAVALLPRHYHPRPLESVLNNFLSGGRIALGFDGGGSEWFVKPDGSDDPPVVVDEWFGDPDDGERPFADRFSVLLFSWVWDGVTSAAWRSPTGFAVQVLNTGFGAMELDFLKEQFQEAETPRWEGARAWYFFAAGQRVMAFRNSPRARVGRDELVSHRRLRRRAGGPAAAPLALPGAGEGRPYSLAAVLEQVRQACGPPPPPT